MARKRNRSAQRDASPIATPETLDSVLRPTHVQTVEPVSTLTRLNRLAALSTARVDDLREYHPEKRFRKALTVEGAVAKKSLVKSPIRHTSRSVTPLTGRFAYSNPASVMVCVRRKMRREVLFALDLRGRGGSGRKRRRTERSRIKC